LLLVLLLVPLLMWTLMLTLSLSFSDPLPHGRVGGAHGRAPGVLPAALRGEQGQRGQRLEEEERQLDAEPALRDGAPLASSSSARASRWAERKPVGEERKWGRQLPSGQQQARQPGGADVAFARSLRVNAYRYVHN